MMFVIGPVRDRRAGHGSRGAANIDQLLHEGVIRLLCS